MAIGSLDSWYTSGSMYKRFQLSESQRMNRNTVAAFDAQVAAAGTLIFGQASTQSEQLSVLAVQQMQQRIVASFHSTFDSADAAKSSALNLVV